MREVRIDPADVCGADLSRFIIVVVRCVFCPAERVVDHAWLQRPRLRNKPLSQVRFRCGRCKTSGTHADKTVTVHVVKLPRNV